MQQHGEAAGKSGVAAAYRTPSQRMATQTAAQQAASATAAEPQAAQRGKLTAFSSRDARCSATAAVSHALSVQRLAFGVERA